MKVTIAQLNMTIGDIEGNFNKIIEASASAVQADSDLFVTSELALTGYPPLDLLERRDFLDNVNIHIQKLKKRLPPNILCVIGAPSDEMHNSQERIFSAAFVFHKKEIVGVVKKTLLPTYDVFDERRHFTPNNEPAKVFKHAGERIGITICEDIWNDEKLNKTRKYDSDPMKALKKEKPTIVLNISASPWETNKSLHRSQIVLHASKRWWVDFIYVNQVGGNDTLIFDGRSFVTHKGKTVKTLKAFEEDVSHFDYNSYEREKIFQPDKQEDLFRALQLGVRDYFHKLGFTKAVLGLSGGIDSALIAVIAAYALGKENVLAVMMPGEYSSDHSISDSDELVDNLGIEKLLLPINSVFDSMKGVLRDGVGKSGFSDEAKAKMMNDDVTEENLQSRIRGQLLMALSNKYGYLVLATGNKSEMSTGYATLYGDMCGALAPIGDLFKTEVFALSRFLHEKHNGVIPLNIIEKPPSAELRPDQKDEDSLPPYEVLDDILRLYIEKGKSIDDISEKHNAETVKWAVNTLHRNEYKRHQAPPILKLGKKALRPGRFFPIVQRYHTH